MKNLLFLLIAARGLLFHSPAQAQERIPIERSDAGVQALLDHSRKTITLSSDFVQEKHLKMLVTPVVSQGIIRFKKPGQLRWEVKSPEPSVAVVDGKSVMISRSGKGETVTPADRQAFSAITNLIEGIVSGDLLSGETMVPAFFRSKEGLLVELSLRSPHGNRLKHVTLLLTPSTTLAELR